MERIGTGESAEVRRLVSACDFFSLPGTLRKARPQPWDFDYTVSVEDGPRAHTIRCHKDAVPPELRRLIETLEPSARVEPPSA